MRAAVVTSVACLLLPAGANAQEEAEHPRPNPAIAALDAVFLRPLQFVGVVVGVAAFIPTAIVTAPGGKDSIQTALNHFVIFPAKDTFLRPLGDF